MSVSFFKTEKLPFVKIKKMKLKNFKVFSDVEFDFSTSDGCKDFICFFGNNGCGKTTIMDVVRLIFTKFEKRDKENIHYILSKSIRKGKDDFSVFAQIESSVGDYEIELNKNGFIKDHPDYIKTYLYRLFYYARYDQELNIFQLKRNKWKDFKKIFESITGFDIEEEESVFNSSEDPVQAEMMNEYVLGFKVKKEDETISHKECSAGERKIIKSFSTILNKEYIPSIVCIDNIEMHVESGRHINMVGAIRDVFSDTQIFSTTHSYHLSKNFKDRDSLYDLRILKQPKNIQNNPWRFYLFDEINDSLFKVNSVCNKMKIKDCVEKASVLKKELMDADLQLDEKEVSKKAKNYFEMVSRLFVDDIFDRFHQDNFIKISN